MDAPYNLLPSLHVALCLLLAHTYARHTRGMVRTALIVWFVLIGLSAVLTYQHHVLDVAGGAALAGYCFYFVRDSSPRLPVNPNRRIGFYYAVGALAFGVVAFVFWPWGALLLWPSIALLIAASGYFELGPSIYRKSEGVLPISTLFTLGPCLLGQHLSLLYYRRQCQAWDQVTPQVWIGCVLNDREARGAIGAGVTAALDLAAEFSETKPFRKICYRNIPILDLTAPTITQLSEMADFIDEHSRNGVVYVHCKIGYSRKRSCHRGLAAKNRERRERRGSSGVDPPRAPECGHPPRDHLRAATVGLDFAIRFAITRSCHERTSPRRSSGKIATPGGARHRRAECHYRFIAHAGAMV